MNNKFILDACCGGRMFWFNKKHPNTLYVDIRKTSKGYISTHPNFQVNPDKIVDFRNMPFQDNSFKLIVFDPPHLKSLFKTSWMAKKYGVLDKDNWKGDLTKGFNECWRVLDDYGTLILKWSVETEARSISIKELLKLFPEDPLFGHTSGLKSNTKWFCFMKIPKVTT